LRKITAILLFLLLLFNLCGYKLWFYYKLKKSDKKVEASIDNHQYNDADLITIKISIPLPYQTNWSSFQRVDGEISFNGKIYKYVKRKVWNSELILLCLPDENKMHLETAKDDFFRLVNDLQQNTSKKTHSENILKNTLSDYDKLHDEQVFYISSVKINYTTSKNIFALTLKVHNIPEQPPETLAA